jgi:hypothetical protein
MKDFRKLDFTPRWGVHVVEVVVIFKDGFSVVEEWEGPSSRWAVFRARDHYRYHPDIFWIGFASGETI